MGTSSSYGGSSKKVWKDARQQVLDLPSSGGGGGDGPPPPESDINDVLDNLWGTVGDALDSDDPSLHAPSIDPSEISTSGSGGGSGGAGGGAERTGGGRQGGGSKRQVTRSAARGGAVLGAAHAVQRGDSAYLSELGLDLERLKGLSIPRQCGEILNAVLGEGSHPDEAALRKASLESLKEILTADTEPNEVDSVHTFVTSFVFELMLVELQQQVNDKALAPEDVAKQEKLIKGYLDKAVKKLSLSKTGTIQPRELRAETARLTKEAVKVLRARKSGNTP
jgi:hypothetical protein